MYANNLSFSCIAFNIALLILAFTPVTYINVLFLLSPMFAFCGVLLGIGAIVLKESFLKSVLAIVLNMAYVPFFFELFKW